MMKSSRGNKTIPILMMMGMMWMRMTMVMSRMHDTHEP